MSQNKKPTNKIPTIATIGGVLIAIILILSTLWTGQVAKKDTDTAVRNVSLLYLNELAGRREQVIESNLNNRIRDLNAAISMLTPEDLSDIEHLQNYQMRIKKLYNLDKFAFVDTDGLIYTSTEIQNNIEDYDFDYLNISEAEISILNLDTPQKKVIIATPVSLNLGDAKLVVCFPWIPLRRIPLSATYIPQRVLLYPILFWGVLQWKTTFWKPCKTPILKTDILWIPFWIVFKTARKGKYLLPITE